MKMFEYKTIQFKATGLMGGKIDNDEVTNELNILGAQGWELVSMLSGNKDYGATRSYICVLKREK